MKKEIILAAASLMISAGVMAQTTPQTKAAPVKQATAQTSMVAHAKSPAKSSVKKSPASKKKTAPIVNNTQTKSAEKK